MVKYVRNITKRRKKQVTIGLRFGQWMIAALCLSILQVMLFYNNLAVQHQIEEKNNAVLVGHGALSANTIVERAYTHTFGQIVNSCNKDQKLKDCFQKYYNRITARHEYGGTTVPSGTAGHWWFQSMVRDAFDLEPTSSYRSGLSQHWHTAQAIEPNITMCLIEKVGTKSWREVFIDLNKDYSPSYDLPLRHNMNSSDLIDLPVPRESSPSFVFLRDPLERFLSAYLDKCVDSSHRVEKHCMPNEIFDTESEETRSSIELMKGFSFDRNKKTMFAAYVDVMPLRWNMHFFPQSLYCNGLYRYLEDYDFVGYMNADFYETLGTVAKRYGGRFETSLIKNFKLTPEKMRLKQSKMKNTGIETSAPEKVKEYYSPRALRRVLEYVSIDYVLLGLDIPDCVDEILNEDQ